MKLTIVSSILLAYLCTAISVSAYPVRRSESSDALVHSARDIASLETVQLEARAFDSRMVERGLWEVVKAIRKGDTPEQKAHRKEYKASVAESKRLQKAAGKVISAQAKQEMGAKDWKKGNIAMTWQSYKGSGGEYERKAKKHLEDLVRKDWKSKGNQQNMRHADLSIEVLKSGRIMGQVRYNNGPNQIPQSSNTFLWDP
ncbi:hypothetical protein JR316_0011244 [Psilocybe cubensis]|uniref:Uncharacterized protein n=2 Tax=Psilocybe cubensis TaxID=181762 RepID=A0A8H7XU54_PSICU|nr:hypothetical protein JR316_0011244 [Psilocybe cubensis]KAH9475685.1 hypothetical protein JR316_0011244 [Psilocybe cubensis]